MSNVNALEGVKCPRCGQEEAFTIHGEATFTVTDDGVSDFIDPDWDEESRTTCVKCFRSGRMVEYMVSEVTIPKPGDCIDSKTVIASVWVNDDANIVLLLMLEEQPPYFTVVEAEADMVADEWRVKVLDRFPNIVPAVEYYKENGGDY